MNFKKQLILGAAIGFFAASLSTGVAYATDQDVDASIQTRAAISLTKNTDMAFGIVDYAAMHDGQIRLGTNGTPVLSGDTGLTLSGGTPTAGSINVSGDGTSTIEISCETGGTLAETGGATITLSAVEFTTGAGGAPGTGTACAGLGISPGTADLGAGPTTTILMGGTLDVSGNAITASGTYSTTIGAGDPVTLRVVYQ